MAINICFRISKGVVRIICGMLYYKFLKDNVKYNMFQPQHPLVTLLINNAECFPYIYKEIRFTSKVEEM